MRQNIIDILTKYKNFDECIIEDIKFNKQGFQVEFLFHYIYDEKGNINVDLNRKVNLIFNGVHEFRIHNNWNVAAMIEPNRINWSHNEVALIKLADRNSYLLKGYTDTQNDNKFYHCEILFESGRRIDIVFNDIKIVEEK